jgi:uncharacterized membrane protein YjfL (UPF0719 family)
VTSHVAAARSVALPDGFWPDLGQGIGAIALYAVVGVLLLVIGFYAIDFTTPGKLSELVRTGKPNAVIVTASGMLSMAFIIVFAILNSANDLTAGLIQSLVFGFIGLVAQVLATRLLEWITRLGVGEIIEQEAFAPVSAVVAAVHLSLGLVVAFAIL